MNANLSAIGGLMDYALLMRDDEGERPVEKVRAIEVRPF
jgi:hypothetical protein